MKRLIFLGAFAGCAADPDPGAVAASWRTGGLTCGEAGLATVRVELFAFDDAEPEAEGEVPCAAGEHTLEGVEPGSYTLWLEGVDAEGCWTHEARADIRVSEAETCRVDELPLLPRPRSLDVRWPFADGSDCEANGVDQVLVVVEGVGDFRVQELFLCGGERRRIDGVPAAAFTVQIEATDPSGAPVARGRSEVGVEAFLEQPCPDEPLEVRVPLESCPRPGCP